MNCPACSGDLEQATIAYALGGDEYDDTYYRCRGCAAYCVETVHEKFLGGRAAAPTLQPLDKERGSVLFEIASRCREGDCRKDWRCDCPAHRDFYRLLLPQGPQEHEAGIARRAAPPFDGRILGLVVRILILAALLAVLGTVLVKGVLRG